MKKLIFENLVVKSRKRSQIANIREYCIMGL